MGCQQEGLSEASSSSIRGQRPQGPHLSGSGDRKKDLRLLRFSNGRCGRRLCPGQGMRPVGDNHRFLVLGCISSTYSFNLFYPIESSWCWEVPLQPPLLQLR